MDEPLGALDKKLLEHMQVELRTLQRQVGITCVYVTHDQEEALALSDRIPVTNYGRLQQVGTPPDIYERPALLGCRAQRWPPRLRIFRTGRAFYSNSHWPSWKARSTLRATTMRCASSGPS